MGTGKESKSGNSGDKRRLSNQRPPLLLLQEHQHYPGEDNRLCAILLEGFGRVCKGGDACPDPQGIHQRRGFDTSPLPYSPRLPLPPSMQSICGLNEAAFRPQVLNVCWANDDPNPTVIRQIKRDRSLSPPP